MYESSLDSRQTLRQQALLKEKRPAAQSAPRGGSLPSHPRFFQVVVSTDFSLPPTVVYSTFPLLY